MYRLIGLDTVCEENLVVVICSTDSVKLQETSGCKANAAIRHSITRGVGYVCWMTRLKAIKKDIMRHEMQLAAQRTRRELNREKKTTIATRKLGRFKYEDPNVEIKLTSELPRSLRQLKVRSTLCIISKCLLSCTDIIVSGISPCNLQSFFHG